MTKLLNYDNIASQFFSSLMPLKDSPEPQNDLQNLTEALPQNGAPEEVREIQRLFKGRATSRILDKVPTLDEIESAIAHDDFALLETYIRAVGGNIVAKDSLYEKILKKFQSNEQAVQQFYSRLHCDADRDDEYDRITVLDVIGESKDLRGLPFLQKLAEEHEISWRFADTVRGLAEEYPDHEELKSLLERLIVEWSEDCIEELSRYQTSKSEEGMRPSFDTFFLCFTEFAAINPNHPMLQKVAASAVEAFRDDIPVSILDDDFRGIFLFMNMLGYKKAAGILKTAAEKIFFQDADRTDFTNSTDEEKEDVATIEFILHNLGVSDREIKALGSRPEKEPDFERPESKAVWILLQNHRAIKSLVFHDAEVSKMFEHFQAWITINEPSLANSALEELGKNQHLRGSMDNILKTSIGTRSGNLDEDAVNYYADEILDAFAQVCDGRKDLSPEVSHIVHQIRYGGKVKIRYIKREKADLSLGDKCGDCTAKESINFENSVLWVANPNYQIVKMSKNGRFLGKMHLAIAMVNGAPGIYIDALEFNPQALEGKPYYEDAKECFEKTLFFCRVLADKLGCSLYGLLQSNSSEAAKILQNKSIPDKKNYSVILSIPDKDIRRVLDAGGHEGDYQIYYQIDGQEFAPEQEKPDEDKKLAILEREIFNPAQIADPEIGKAMRSRNFPEAAQIILKNSEWRGKLYEIYRLPQTVSLSPEFLVRTMERIYPQHSSVFHGLSKSFLVNRSKFVRLS